MCTPIYEEDMLVIHEVRQRYMGDHYPPHTRHQGRQPVLGAARHLSGDRGLCGGRGLGPGRAALRDA